MPKYGTSGGNSSRQGRTAVAAVACWQRPRTRPRRAPRHGRQYQPAVVRHQPPLTPGYGVSLGPYMRYNAPGFLEYVKGLTTEMLEYDPEAATVAY